MSFPLINTHLPVDFRDEAPRHSRPATQQEQSFKDVGLLRGLRRTVFASIPFAVTAATATAQPCNYNLQDSALILALSERALSEAQDDDFESACETMREVLGVYQRQIRSFVTCGDQVTAVRTQTAARSAAALARSYCDNTDKRTRE